MKRVLGVLFSLFLCLVALRSPAEGFSHGGETPASAPEDPFKKLRIVKPAKKIMAPDFGLEALSGKRVRLRGWRGKVVFLNFWATWCGPCRLEMPTMEKLHRELREEGLEVVAINLREGKKEVRAFVDELGLSFTILLDRDGKVSDEYGAWSIPLTYIINQKGAFVAKAIGYREWDSQEAVTFFRGLLAGKP